MGAAALQRRRCRQGLPGLPGLLGREIRRPADRLSRSSGVESPPCVEARGATTLDDLIANAWEGLSVCETVRCPACGGEMASDGGAMTRADAPNDALHGECVDCGAQLC